MSGPAKKLIPPEWSVIPGGPILWWSLSVENRDGRFKLRFYRTTSDEEEENGKKTIRAVSRLSYILVYPLVSVSRLSYLSPILQPLTCYTGL
mgnify:CR=1 FL=1